MAKVGLAVLAVLAACAVLVLVAGSIPPQRSTQARFDQKNTRAAEYTVIGRGQAIERVVAERRARTR